MSKKSPMSLTLDYLNKAGWTCEISEHWNAFARVRKDLFGFADIVSYRPGSIALVQTTSASNHATRREKILGSKHYAGLKRANVRILLISWGDKGMRKEEL